MNDPSGPRETLRYLQVDTVEFAVSQILETPYFSWLQQERLRMAHDIWRNRHRELPRDVSFAAQAILKLIRETGDNSKMLWQAIDTLEPWVLGPDEPIGRPKIAIREEAFESGNVDPAAPEPRATLVGGLLRKIRKLIGRFSKKRTGKSNRKRRRNVIGRL